MATSPTLSPRQLSSLSALQASRIKNEFEGELAITPALVYFCDMSSQNRLDILPDEEIDSSSYSLEACTVSKDVALDYRARQLLN